MASIRQRLSRAPTATQSLPDACQHLLALLTEKQRAFVTDPHRYKVARCSRRAGKCLKEGTEVLTPFGPVPIEQLRVGDTVYGYNSDGTVSLTSVTAVIDQGVKDVVDIGRQNRVLVSATPEHRWLTKRNGQDERIGTTAELTTYRRVRRELVAIPCGDVHEPHAYAIGALLGDGCTKDLRVSQLHISSENALIPDRVAEILGAKFHWDHAKNYTWTLSNTARGTARGTKHGEARVECNYYYDWMHGRGSGDKCVDIAVLDSWNRASCLAFLAGLLDTDGSVGLGVDRSLSIRWSSNSLSIITAIQFLLKKLLLADFTIHKESRADHYVIGIKSNLHAPRLLKELTPFIVLDRKKYKDAYGQLPCRSARPDALGLRVMSEPYKAQCWDITVNNDTHLYLLANEGLVTHNTYMIAAYMLYECLAVPGTPVLYAGLTRDSAREAVWPILVDFLEQLDIPHKLHPSALQITFPNRSKLTIFGCDAENARNRLRGRKFKLVCFDETGFYGALDALVYAVLPMLADFKGTLCLTSSPGELLEGLFYEADQGLRKESWSRYFWTIHDNPHFQSPPDDPVRFKTRAEEELWSVCSLQFAGNDKHPGYRREWLGEWVSDHTALCYPVDPVRNLIDISYKMTHQQHALGISLSPFVNAIVVGRYSDYSREFQIIEAREFEDMEIDDFAKIVESAIQTYVPSNIVADTGVYTKDVVMELRRRYQIPVTFIDDKDKSFHQKIFANDLRSGYIKVKRNLSIVEKFAKIVKDATTGEEIRGQPNYSPNAALALYRRIYQTTLSSFEPPLTEEQRHIKQLEDSRDLAITPWYEL